MDKMKKGILWLFVLFVCTILGCGNSKIDADENSVEFISQDEESDKKDGTEEVFSTTLEEGEMDNHGDISEISGAMVQLVSGSAMGSGVIYKETEKEWIVLTAGHVLADVNNTFVVFENGVGMVCDEIRMAKDSDIAFLQINKEKVPSEVSEKLHSLVIEKIAYDRLKVGDEVKAIGSYHEIGKDICQGVVKEKMIYAAGIREMVILTEMKCFAGMSGGGVFDQEGQFLGIVCAVDEDEETAVIPLITILAKDMELFWE